MIARNLTTSSFRFFVTLSEAATGAVGVNYVTQPGTVTLSSDFTQTSGTLNFAVGETSKEVVVPVIRDASVESNETFLLLLLGLGLTH